MRRLLSLCLLAVVVVFAVQNYEVTEIHFVVWSVTMSRALVVFLAFVMGLLIGWLTPLGRRTERSDRHAPSGEEPSRES